MVKIENIHRCGSLATMYIYYYIDYKMAFSKRDSALLCILVVLSIVLLVLYCIYGDNSFFKYGTVVASVLSAVLFVKVKYSKDKKKEFFIKNVRPLQLAIRDRLAVNSITGKGPLSKKSDETDNGGFDFQAVLNVSKAELLKNIHQYLELFNEDSDKNVEALREVEYPFNRFKPFADGQMYQMASGFLFAANLDLDLPLPNMFVKRTLKVRSADGRVCGDETCIAEWFRNANKYIENLPARDVATMMAYTFLGDRKVNPYLRGTLSADQMCAHMSLNDEGRITFAIQALDVLRVHSRDYYHEELISLDDIKADRWAYDNIDFPIKLETNADTVGKFFEKGHANFVTQYSLYRILCEFKCFTAEFWKRVLDAYTTDLTRIILNAPRTTQPITVYRGIGSSPFDPSTLSDSLFVNKGYVSTSLNYHSAEKYAKKSIFRIVLMPDTPCIPMVGLSHYADEAEVLLPHDTVYFVSSFSQREKSSDKTNIGILDVIVVR